MAEREVQIAVDSLCNPREPVESSLCKHLTNLSREEQERLNDSWTSIPVEKRRELVSLLSEQADQDVLLDFSSVFRHGLRDSDAEVRNTSVRGLREDEAVTLIRPFLRLLAEDSSMEVRASAASALGHFVLQGELGYLTDERNRELVEALARVIADDSLPVSVRRRAVESLAYSGDERVREIIARAYEDVSEEMRISAVTAMGRSADEYWRGTARIELLNENPDARLEAARAAGELTDGKAVARLILLLADSDPGVRQMAVWALGQIGGNQAREALKIVAKSENTAMRLAARDSLAEMSLFDDENPTLSSPALFDADEEIEDDDLYDDEDDDDLYGEDEEWDDEELDEDENPEWQTMEVLISDEIDFDEDDDYAWDDEAG